MTISITCSQGPLGGAARLSGRRRCAPKADTASLYTAPEWKRSSLDGFQKRGTEPTGSCSMRDTRIIQPGKKPWVNHSCQHDSQSFVCQITSFVPFPSLERDAQEAPRDNSIKDLLKACNLHNRPSGFWEERRIGIYLNVLRLRAVEDLTRPNAH